MVKKIDLEIFMDLKVFSPSEYKRGNYGKNELPIFL
jgi:hypothetical protein